MKTRSVTLASGEHFTVPQGIQRLDAKSTHGWQVRYQGTKYFPDSGGGPRKAFETAIRELLRRINTMPAPVVLKRAPSPRKANNLPPGISGPILVRRANSDSQSAVLSVLLPRFGKTNQVRQVHIGTPSTYTAQRYQEALARAIELREAALLQYEEAATKARRKVAQEIKRTMLPARAAAKKA